MTVPSSANRSGPYNGNGVTTVFNYGFRILDENHLTVIKTVGGVETVLVIDADYIVSDVGADAGGQIAVTPAPASGSTITILRNVPFTQETDLENQGAYFAETIESALDRGVMRDQQLSERLDRAVTIPASANGSALNELVEDVLRLADSADEIDVVASNIGAVNTAATNIAAIIDAPNQASAAAASAVAASDSADAAAADLASMFGIFLGAYASDGDAETAHPDREVGSRYFNTVEERDRVWTGSMWAHAGNGDMVGSANLSDVSNSTLSAGNLNLIERDTVALLLADTILDYSAGTGKTAVATDQIVKAGGFRYEVVDGAASDAWLIVTAGGVKLSSADNAPPPDAFGAVGNGATDDTAALVKWLAYHDGKGLKFLNLRPKIYLADELVFPDDVIVFGNNATIKRRVNQAYPLVLVGKRSTVHELRADGNSDALGGTGGGTRMSGIVLDDDAKAYNCESFKNARHGFANRNVADQLQYTGIELHSCHGHDNGIPHPTDPPSAGTGSGDDFNLTNCADWVARDCRSKNAARNGFTVTSFNTVSGETDPTLTGWGLIDNLKVNGSGYIDLDIEIAPKCRVLNFDNPGASISCRGSADVTIRDVRCNGITAVNVASPVSPADRVRVYNADIENNTRSNQLLELGGADIVAEDVRCKSAASPTGNMVVLRASNSKGVARNIDVDGANVGIVVDVDNVSGLTGRNVSGTQVRYGPAANSYATTFNVNLKVNAGVAELIGTAAPTTGTWAQHSIVRRSYSSGQPTFWQCSVAGASGTWVAGANWA